MLLFSSINTVENGIEFLEQECVLVVPGQSSVLHWSQIISVTGIAYVNAATSSIPQVSV